MLKKSFFKKLFVPAIALMLAFSISACSDEGIFRPQIEPQDNDRDSQGEETPDDSGGGLSLRIFENPVLGEHQIMFS